MALLLSVTLVLCSGFVINIVIIVKVKSRTMLGNKALLFACVA